MDENRDYGGHKQQGGTTKETVAQELQDFQEIFTSCVVLLRFQL